MGGIPGRPVDFLTGHDKVRFAGLENVGDILLRIPVDGKLIKFRKSKALISPVRCESYKPFKELCNTDN